jgi:hypothetical protein
VKTLRLLNLQRKDDDTSTKPIKETLLAVENGIFHVFGPKSMMNKSEWMINADIQFYKQAKISFFDEDLIRNLSTTKNFQNYIVEEKIESNDRLNKINIVTDTTNYVLTYEVR